MNIYTFNGPRYFVEDFSDLAGKKIHIMRGYYYALLEDSVYASQISSIVEKDQYFNFFSVTLFSCSSARLS